MPLNKYQKNILKKVRADQRNYGIEFITLSSGAGYSALDAYRKQVYSGTSAFFSGSLLFNPFSAKRDAEGGFYKTSDLVIVASRDYKTTAQSKNVKIKYENIEFRVARVVDCEDTNEIVIYASRLE